MRGVTHWLVPSFFFFFLKWHKLTYNDISSLFSQRAQDGLSSALRNMRHNLKVDISFCVSVTQCKKNSIYPSHPSPFSHHLYPWLYFSFLLFSLLCGRADLDILCSFSFFSTFCGWEMTCACVQMWALMYVCNIRLWVRNEPSRFNFTPQPPHLQVQLGLLQEVEARLTPSFLGSCLQETRYIWVGSLSGLV